MRCGEWQNRLSKSFYSWGSPQLAIVFNNKHHDGDDCDDSDNDKREVTDTDHIGIGADGRGRGGGRWCSIVVVLCDDNDY